MASAVLTVTQEVVLGMGAHFFGLMSNLWSVRVFKVIPLGVDNVSSEGQSTRGYPHRTVQHVPEELAAMFNFQQGESDDGEFEEAKFNIVVIVATRCMHCGRKRGCPIERAYPRVESVLSEIQLKTGCVWRRAGPDDVWTQRSLAEARGGARGGIGSTQAGQ